jgi:hypothetical protein
MNLLSSLWRSREVVGLMTGLLMIAAWWFRLAMLAEPGWLLLAIVFLSSVAGFIIGGTSSRHGEEPSRAVRVGVWTAAITGIVAASIFALIARESFNPIVHFRAKLGGLLSILPAMFYGMFAAGVSALTFARTKLPKQDVPAPALPSSMLWTVRGIIALLVWLGVQLPVTTEPAPTAEAPRIIASRPQAPTPPSFAYTVPTEMVTAQALQWKLANGRTITEVDSQLIALSQDDRWLACVPQHEKAVRAVDLHSSTTRQVALPRPIDRLSFSPSADRLFVTMSTSPAEIAVVDFTSSRYMRLPKPKNREMPSGSLLWWRDKEILITSGSERLILNLDTLEIDEASTVASWKETDSALRDKIVREMRGDLRETPRWRWQLVPLIESTELPEVLGTSGWPMKKTQALAMLHPDRDSRIVFPSISAQPVDRFLSSHDGSKVLRVRGNSIRVSYFGIGPTVPLKWTVAMPHAPADSPDATKIEAALKAGTLSAIIYPPMTNPLNQQVVGSERDVVKAVVTFVDWKDKTATVYVSQRFATIASSDVIADVNAWKDDQPELLSMHTPHRWWTPLGEPMAGSDAITSIPTIEEKSKLLMAAREAEEDLRKTREDEERKAKVEAEERMAKQERERRAAMTPTPVPPPVSTPHRVIIPPEPTTPAGGIRSFLLAHHQKAEKSDVIDLVRDYAIKVDYFNNGLVDRNWILQDELKYHNNNAVLEESIIGEIRVNRLPGGSGYTATYPLRVRTQDKATNRIGGGTFEVNLIIIETADGLQIARQRSEKKP